MRRWLILLCASAASLFALALQQSGAAAGLTVRKAIDGDTVILSDGRHLRLIGVDTPELGHGRAPDEPFAAAAAARTAELVAGQTVEIEGDRAPFDKYHRPLGYLWFRGAGGERTLLNLQLAEEGWGISLFYSPNGKYRVELDRAQAAAIEAGRGLWSRPDFAVAFLRKHHFVEAAGAEYIARWWLRQQAPPLAALAGGSLTVRSLKGAWRFSATAAAPQVVVSKKGGEVQLADSRRTR
jgi:endonuclease YncB( thermonuclease family)